MPTPENDKSLPIRHNSALEDYILFEGSFIARLIVDGPPDEINATLWSGQLVGLEEQPAVDDVLDFAGIEFRVRHIEPESLRLAAGVEPVLILRVRVEALSSV